MYTFFEGLSWLALAQVVVIDLMLGGDNAVVIALASRKLPESLRRRAVLLGMVGAIAARVVLLFLAVQLLEWPGLKLVGGGLLLWIGAQLLAAGADEADAVSANTFYSAVRTIIVADVVMSLDNVVAVAGAANGSVALAALGVMLSIPLILFGSQVILRLMANYPWLVAAGASLLGWVAATLAFSDPFLASVAILRQPWSHYVEGMAGAAAVLALGMWMRKRTLRHNAEC